MRKTSCVILVLLMAIVLSGCKPKPSFTEGKRVVGYYAQWVADQRGYFVSSIPADKLTHINYAFANVTDDGKCILGDIAADTERVYSAEESVNGKADSTDPAALHGNFNQLLQLKEKYPHIQTLISIGGWTWSENFSDAALTDDSRKVFVQSCVDLFLKQYKGVFDGIDIDWEYPVSGGEEPDSGRPEDKQNFTLLLAEFRSQLDELGKADGKQYLLTIAAPGGGDNNSNYEWAELSQSLDWINVMAYDLHGLWETKTNFNAPLYSSSGDPGSASQTVDASIRNYLNAGIPAEKIVLGVPFYGHGWQGVPETNNGLFQANTGGAPGKYESGSFYYTELKADYFETYTRYWNDESQVPWLYNPSTKIFISYEDPESIAAKAGYAKDNGLGGVMIWELSQGDDDMLDAIQTGFKNGGLPHIVPTVDPNALLTPRPFTMELHRISGITIDGKLDDWPAEPSFVLNDASQIAHTVAPDSWKGPQDLSAEVWQGWSEEGLYFALRVVDDAHYQTVADSDLWHGDYAEWQFDTQLEKDYNNPGMNNDDYQIGVSVGDYANVPPVAYAWFNGPDASNVIAIQQAYVQTSDGYILEVFFPKELLKELTLEEGAVFGMNVSLSDTDSAGTQQKVMLSTSATRIYTDPRTFGKIILVK
jgi:GH18 family chitinase